MEVELTTVMLHKMKSMVPCLAITGEKKILHLYHIRKFSFPLLTYSQPYVRTDVLVWGSTVQDV